MSLIVGFYEAYLSVSPRRACLSRFANSLSPRNVECFVCRCHLYKCLGVGYAAGSGRRVNSAHTTLAVQERPDRLRFLWRFLFVGLVIFTVYAVGVMYWAQYQTESFCEDQVVTAGPYEGIAASAVALGFRVRSGSTRDPTTGLILIHRETPFGTSYCDVQYIDGMVVTRSAGWF
jgi:hypothetical protein